MAFPYDSSPASLCTLTRADKFASCEVRFVPNGVEARALRKGKLLWSRIFENEEEALAEAEGERVRMLVDGWTPSVNGGHGGLSIS